VNILVVSQWFPPEPGGGPARFLEMGHRWQELGHEVTVLAGTPNWPTGKVAPGYESRLRLRERYQGLPVIRSWVYATPNEGVVKRIVNHGSFLASAPLAALRLSPRPDVVVATSPPLFAAIAGLAIARRFGARFVFDVRDLWPDVIFALDQMRSPVVRRLLGSVERRLYRNAGMVVAVSPRFRDPILAREAKAVEVITNGADLDFFSPGPPDPQLRESWGGKDQFVVLYAGTLGLAHGLKTVLDAAELLKDRPIRFVLVGEGAERAGLEAEAERRTLTNVHFAGLQPRERMPDVYRSADICLVALRPLPLLEAFIPSKIFEILACGRPMIAAVSGEPLESVNRAGAAFPAEPGSVRSLADAVERALSSDSLAEMGVSGRRFVEQHFDRRELADRYLRVLEHVRSSTPTAGP
jgi:glycosyltransferase involved in cell wall biosynthesis